MTSSNDTLCSRKQFWPGSLILLWVMLLVHGCAPYADLPAIVPVVVKPGETLSTLAEKHLGDPEMGWLIADFNHVQSVSPGQEIIIPLEPFSKGGLSPLGYQTVPILAYHDFSVSTESLMTVKKRSFERQMAYLKNHGYVPVTLDELFDFLEYRRQLPRKAVVITFDDGWQGVYTIAFPILQKYGFPATLFVYTDLISGNKRTLNWQKVAELDRGGVDIQCHTKTHRNLTAIEGSESFENYFLAVQQEILESTRIIKEKIGKDVKYMAYPYGDANNLVIAVLKQAGFRGAFTVRRDANPFYQDHYSLNRSMIYGDFDLNDFKRNLKTYSSKALN